MTETRKPDPTDPADPGGNDAPKPQPDVIVLPSGSVVADSSTPLLTGWISPVSTPRVASSSLVAGRSSTAKFSRRDPARSASMVTCTQPALVTCHSTRVGIGRLSAGRPKSA
jgi:hypothetical protein